MSASRTFRHQGSLSDISIFSLGTLHYGAP
jgi:hypothetical protein